MSNKQNPYQIKSITEVLTELKVEKNTGLSDEEVKQRQLTYGLNEVIEKKPSKVFLFLKNFYGLTAIMLELTIIISFLLSKFMDAYLISGLMLFNALIGYIQENKASKTVEALKKNLQVVARALRNGKWTNINGNQLVPGDIIRIRTGDFITADAKIIDGTVHADQSALTGESMPISKKEGDVIFSGSVIKNGECTAVVTSTGTKTFFGKTAQLVQTAKHKLHMEEVVASIVKILFLIVIIFVGITTVVSLLRGESFLSILPLLLILLVSAVPVALPAMFTVSMASGAAQLANKGILVSRLSATEDAATLTTLCIDKTGTITQNKLTIKEIVPLGNFKYKDVLLYGVLASVEANNDPIDLAFFQKIAEEKIDASNYKLISFTPFSAEIKRTEAVVQKDNINFKVLKGAYNTIKNLCKVENPNLDQTVNSWAEKGFKTIAVAIEKDNATQLVGIAALFDPPVPDSAQMISEIKNLGVKVKMLTGDALPIAKEIASQVGIGDNVASASLLRNDNVDNHSVIVSHSGFAEVLPEDKFTIVKNLQQHKEITGMTGDGVNDAPALKQAEVGIAVHSATDVAKQAASVILLKPGLESIINLISVGRTIHHRIANWVISKISKTLFTVLFVCASYLITGQFIVNAFDMVMLLFIIDFVSLALSTDNVSWSKKPETWNTKPLIKRGFLLGILLIIEAMFWLFAVKDYFKLTDINQLQSFGFSILFFASVFNVMIIRTDGRFYKQTIGGILLWVLIADILLVVTLLTIGLIGFTSLPIIITISTLFYFAFCSFIINDWIKVKV
ncbi:MAG: plasma-membrane proton-efflux P-type ATPase [Bacteroidales bacterium]